MSWYFPQAIRLSAIAAAFARKLDAQNAVGPSTHQHYIPVIEGKNIFDILGTETGQNPITLQAYNPAGEPLGPVLRADVSNGKSVRFTLVDLVGDAGTIVSHITADSTLQTKMRSWTGSRIALKSSRPGGVVLVPANVERRKRK